MSDYAAARSIVVLADCHIHPGDGIAWPATALAAFAGADLIITLGDMGEASGLAALAAIAPVLGVRGADDQDNPYISGTVRLLDAGGVAIVLDLGRVGPDGRFADADYHRLGAGLARF